MLVNTIFLDKLRKNAEDFSDIQIWIVSPNFPTTFLLSSEKVMKFSEIIPGVISLF
jgi:hypothetical protein